MFPGLSSLYRVVQLKALVARLFLHTGMGDWEGDSGLGGCRMSVLVAQGSGLRPHAVCAPAPPQHHKTWGRRRGWGSP